MSIFFDVKCNLHNDRSQITISQIGDDMFGDHALKTEGYRLSMPLYTAAQRQRRDATGWTLVQAVLAPIQFLVFAISVCLVLRYMATGDGFVIATSSVILKTVILYAIMVTGAIWEKVVFGQYLFAPAFFWEDVISMIVLALHTAYIASVFIPGAAQSTQMSIALAAYGAYLVNAAQYVWKMRRARLETSSIATPAGVGA